jgi:hypothetical protein
MDYVISNNQKVCAYIFFDLPNVSNNYLQMALKDGKPIYFCLFETKEIRPINWDKNLHKLAEKIFTWDDSLVNNIKYFKINFSQDIKNNKKNLECDKKKLCCLIASNKQSKYSNELYSERIRAIKWFEQHCPEDFDLFGFDWDKRPLSQNKYLNFIYRKLPILRKLFYSKFNSFRGSVASKHVVIKNYKFSICYENFIDYEGYITEKIFDSFFGDCVPVYLGASNINLHIPSSCYIDKKKFNTYLSLYKYLKNMPDSEYQKYLKEINLYLNSNSVNNFSSKFFASQIVSNLNC